MSEMGEKERVLVFGERAHDSCGYCGGGPSVSFAMRLPALASRHYEDLVNRGWARAGKRLYKPVMHETCCPQYTIRLDTQRFQISKSQRGVLKAMARFLHHGSTKARTATKAEDSPVISLGRGRGVQQSVCHGKTGDEVDAIRDRLLSAAVVFLTTELQLPDVENLEEAFAQAKVTRNTRVGRGDFCSNVAMVLAAYLRRVHQLDLNGTFVAQKIVGHYGVQDGDVTTANGFINITKREASVNMEEARCFMEPQTCGRPPHTTESVVKPCQKRKLSQVSDEQTSHHSDDDEQVQGHVLTIETTPAVCTPERFALYSHYQQLVHGEKADEITEAGCTRFIADSPLYDESCPSPPADLSSIVRVISDGSQIDVVPCDSAGNVELGAVEAPIPDGSYHQLFRLDGKLIAVSVLDVTESALSSIYCFYDPAYRYLTLGKFCALMEIFWMRRHAATHRPRMQFYYMGYYVHSCHKMLYKADFKPTMVLCPTVLTWHPMEECIPIFERFRFSPLQPNWAAVRAQIPHDSQQRPITEWVENKTLVLECFAPHMHASEIAMYEDAICEAAHAILPSTSASAWKLKLQRLLHGLIELCGPAATHHIVVDGILREIVERTTTPPPPTVGSS